jgi:hypothetical protein
LRLKKGQKLLVKSMDKLFSMKNIEIVELHEKPNAFRDNQVDDYFNDKMSKFCGRIVTIAYKDRSDGPTGHFFYRIEEDSGKFYWYGRWFEPIKNKKAMKILYG